MFYIVIATLLVKIKWNKEKKFKLKCIIWKNIKNGPNKSTRAWNTILKNTTVKSVILAGHRFFFLGGNSTFFFYNLS